MVQMTQAVLDRFETRIEAWLSKRDRQRRVQCRKGCGFCCNMLNWISLAEAAAVYPVITEHERRHFLRLDVQLLSLAGQYSSDDLFERYRSDLGFCPLFDKDRACRIHPVRPLSCRSVLSFFPPVLCRVDLPRRYGLDRLNAIIDRAPSDEYFETPFALTPILWKEKAAQQLQKIMTERLGHSIEGAFPAMIQLLDHLLRPSAKPSPLSSDALKIWINDRIQAELISFVSCEKGISTHK